MEPCPVLQICPEETEENSLAADLMIIMGARKKLHYKRLANLRNARNRANLLKAANSSVGTIQFDTNEDESAQLTSELPESQEDVLPEKPCFSKIFQYSTCSTIHQSNVRFLYADVYSRVRNTSHLLKQTENLFEQADGVFLKETPESTTLKALRNSFLAFKSDAQELTKLLGVLKQENQAGISELERKFEQLLDEKEALIERLQVRPWTKMIHKNNERLNNEVAMYRSVMDLRARKIDDLHEELEGTSEALDNAHHALQSERSRIRGLRGDYDELREKYRRLTKQLQQRDRQIETLREKLEVTNRDNTKIGRQLARCKGRLKKLRDESPESSDSSTSSEFHKRVDNEKFSTRFSDDSQS
ncbi:unnamed protein product [Caenorhabditis auriculariae]|uniref:Uncharacterized protein n=1 Tax=Caenorhabditis auriculariae TaxID=2777116 RepID=A0A8S1GSG7_9PELO|nr:unnamed protein product [Caenorhabditis auriculariae]